MAETVEVTDVTYGSLTHKCDNPGCHVVGFVESLTFNDELLAAAGPDQTPVADE